MIIVLKPHTSDESIKKIEDVIRARGLNHMFLKENPNNYWNGWRYNSN